MDQTLQRYDKLSSSTANANALFQGLRSVPSFNNAIHIKKGDHEAALLRDARKKIRSVIRAEFTSLKSMLLDVEFSEKLFDRRDFTFREAAKRFASIDVRFLTQGSYAYETLIRPAWPNIQEIDLDDGIYMPLPFVNGLPLFSSGGLFVLIEKALSPLAKKEGWSFKRKSTCVRIELTGQGAHIDLPLFAVEITEFQLLKQQFEKQVGVDLRESHNLSVEFDTNARSIRLREGKILLADREEDWRVSDPKAIHDWFIDQIERYGSVLRRICRYTKSWRDHTWDDCDLSSLVLMVICVEALADLEDRPAEDRDDLMMLHVADHLPNTIRKGNITWQEGAPVLDSHWRPYHREEFAEAAEAMAAEIRKALETCYDSRLVVRQLRNVFGDRIPDAPWSVKFRSENQTDKVVRTAPVTVAMPVVGTSVSA